MKFNGLSLFANVGMAETYLDEIGINVVVANELLEERAKFYRHLYPTTEMIQGDITDPDIYKKVIKKSKEKKVEFIIATPPCQGMSLAGKRDEFDVRNQLIYYAIKAIEDLKPKYVLLENVPQQLRTKVKVENKEYLIPEYLKYVLNDTYYFADQSLVSAMEHGVPQMRKRNIILLTRKDQKFLWQMPEAEKNVVTLREALKYVPSVDPYLREGLEKTKEVFPDFLKKKNKALETSKWHYPPTHSYKLVKVMIHTPSGETAFNNEKFYPKRNDGVRVKGHSNQYRRHNWDKPSRTITQNSSVISSLCCVHPGYMLKEGKTDEERVYSDARCFTIYELLIVSSLPQDWNIPEWATDKLIRSVIGEGIPPLLIKKIVSPLVNNV